MYYPHSFTSSQDAIGIFQIRFQGGPICGQCVTQSGFLAANGSQVSYAIENPEDDTARVGFIMISVDPRTLSEAVRSNGAWSLASLLSHIHLSLRILITSTCFKLMFV